MHESSTAFKGAVEVNEDYASDDDVQDETSTAEPEIDASVGKNRAVELSLEPQFQSLYGSHYQTIAPQNADAQGEPKCTNYAHVYRGTLDYIFVPKETSLQCCALLDMPDIETLRASQPNEGEFPSDHFALGAILQMRLGDVVV